MKKTLLITAIFGLFAFVSCKKAQNDPVVTVTSSLSNVQVPLGFNWESSRNLNVTVSLTDTRFGTASQTISIYDGDPYAGGKLISVGGATTTRAFSGKIYLPTTITQIYVVKTAPDKSTIVEKVAAPGSADINLSIGAFDPAFIANASASTSKQTLATNPTSPDCTSGCTVSITANTSNLNVNSGDVVCITASNITVNFSNVNGGTIRVCGSNVTLQNLSFNGAATLIVTTSGSANIPGINFNNSSAAIQNFGTITYTGAFPDNGLFYNAGVFTCSGDYNLNSNAGVWTNNGTLTVSGNFNDGTTAVATNGGIMTVSGSFQPNSNCQFVNNCSLTVGANYTQSGSVKNYSYINVAATTTINSSVELGMYNGAEIKTKDFIVDGTVAGYGSTSLVKITGTTTIRNSGSVVTNIQIWQTTGIIDAISASKVNISGTIIDHSVYIAKSACNSDGNGTVTVTDTDGDGVPDNLDAYPNDPTRAYNVAGAIGTIAFEDEWPKKGDFDLNDVVMGYSYTLVTSASNTVVSVAGTYTLYARGGDYGNAFGIEFPVSSSLVSGLAVTKGGTAVTSPAFESGQSKAVVILFTNMQTEMATYNTKPGDIFSPYKTYTVSFNIIGGPSLTSFGLDAYNPFIYNSGRGHEVHLSGKTPTSLADATLFGTFDDNTSVSSSRYYVTKTGLPYAINVPLVFAYPVERMDITTAYLHFADWAVSGGSSYADWYSNTGTGYRNTSNIFTH